MFFIKREHNEVTGITTINFVGKLAEKYKAPFENFYKDYEVEFLLVDDKYSRIPLKKRSERVCRFCEKKSPEVMFKKKAHLVPSLIGNTNLFSDFECDSCNLLFGQFENDLANFLGITRSFNPLKKDKVVKFKTPDNKLIVTEGFLDENDKTIKTVIQSHDPDKNHFTLDQEKNELVLHATKHPFTPLKVYKAILKMALSVINDSDKKNYPQAFDVLTSSLESLTENDIYKCFSYSCPGMPFPSPLIMLFKKKDNTKPLPTHVFQIYFLNYIYQIPIPFNELDKWMYDGKIQVQFRIAPPLIDERWANYYGFPQQEILDFSKKSIVTNAIHNVVFAFDSAKLNPES